MGVPIFRATKCNWPFLPQPLSNSIPQHWPGHNKLACAFFCIFPPLCRGVKEYFLDKIQGSLLHELWKCSCYHFTRFQCVDLWSQDQTDWINTSQAPDSFHGTASLYVPVAKKCPRQLLRWCLHFSQAYITYCPWVWAPLATCIHQTDRDKYDGRIN